MSEPAIVSIADRLGTTPATVVLRWHLDLGLVASPKRRGAIISRRTSRLLTDPPMVMALIA
jgi:diketogulonate reductase-like aldo/keto reductase